MMPDKNPEIWTIFLWLYSNINNAVIYALIAGLMAILRGCWMDCDSWGRRIVDAAICAVFAFHLHPAIEIFAGLISSRFSMLDFITNPESPGLLAAFLGFLGTDFISRFLFSKLGNGNRKK